MITPEEFNRIVETARRFDQNQGSRIHDFAHSERVAGYALAIANHYSQDNFGLDLAVVALCHDLGREGDTANLTHGQASSNIARQLVTELGLNVDLDSILFAIEHHSDSRAPNDSLPVAQSYGLSDINIAIPAFLWDADRLELKRLNRTKVAKTRLSTPFAKEYANSDRHEANYEQKGNMTYVTDCLTPTQTANTDAYQGTYITHLAGMFDQGLLSPPKLKELADNGIKSARKAYELSRKKKNPYVSAHRDLEFTRDYAFNNQKHKTAGIKEEGCILGLALPEFSADSFIHVRDQIPSSRIREIYVKDATALKQVQALCQEYDRQDIQVRLLCA